MKALGTNDTRAPVTPRGVSGRVITWESFAKAAMKLEDLDAMLTLVRDRSGSGGVVPELPMLPSFDTGSFDTEPEPVVAGLTLDGRGEE